MRFLMVSLVVSLVFVITSCSETKERVDFVNQVLELKTDSENLFQHQQTQAFLSSKDIVFSFPYLNQQTRNSFYDYCGTYIFQTDSLQWNKVSDSPADSIIADFIYSYNGEKQGKLIFDNYSSQENIQTLRVRFFINGSIIQNESIELSANETPQNTTGTGFFADYNFSFTYNLQNFIFEIADNSDEASAVRIEVLGNILSSSSLPEQITAFYQEMEFIFSNIKLPTGINQPGIANYYNGEEVGFINFQNKQIGKIIFEGNASDWNFIIRYNDNDEYEIPPAVFERWFERFFY
ncbi:MAG: hypothetical protein PHR06_03280 [Candidatus Cloacimonetes bacterium]|nr:hypothetical protein [Candidatus Cloacimonadota bacterium]